MSISKWRKIQSRFLMFKQACLIGVLALFYVALFSDNTDYWLICFETALVGFFFILRFELNSRLARWLYGLTGFFPSKREESRA